MTTRRRRRKRMTKRVTWQWWWWGGGGVGWGGGGGGGGWLPLTMVGCRSARSHPSKLHFLQIPDLSHFYLATTKAKHSGIDWIKTWSHSYTSLNNNIKIGYCVSDKMDASEADLDNFDNVDNFDLPDVQKKRIRPFIILCFRNSFSSLGGDIIISFIFLL